jgi:hypothetical protein
VTVLLALTAGGVTLAAPATAVPVTAPAGTEDQSVTSFPKGDVITGATASGYLTWNKRGGTRSWLPARGGSPTQWTSSTTVAGTGSGDLVATNLALPSGSTAKITDMSTGAVVNRYDIGPYVSGIQYAGAAGTSLFTTAEDSEGGVTLWMHPKGVSARRVTDLPQNSSTVHVVAGTATHAQVIWFTGGVGEPTTRFLGLLDLSTGSMTKTYELPAAALTGDIAVSATHVAWVEYTNDSGAFKAAVSVTDRSTGRSQNIQMGRVWPNAMEIGLQGDWLTYGNCGGLESASTYSSNALSAYNLRTGATRKLLDHLTSAAAAPDGTLFARGGTVAQNEGVYRIAPDQDGGRPPPIWWT